MNTRNRELTRQYKESTPPMGVYLIRNTVNRRVFVGASMNVDGAMNRVRFELGLNSHRNVALQQDWRECGPENFQFEVLDILKKRDEPHFDYKDELDALLDLWREEVHAYGPAGYCERKPGRASLHAGQGADRRVS